MSRPKIIILPGLDGDGFYCAALEHMLGRHYDCRTLSYPRQMSDYADLCEWASDQLDMETDYILIAESFGGPLGLMLADVLGPQAKALVLCATFCEPPLPHWLLRTVALLYPLVIEWHWIAHLLNFFVLGGTDIATSRQLRHALLASPANTITQRIRALCELDLRPAAAALGIPTLVIKATKDRLIWRDSFGKLLPAARISGPHGLIGAKPEAVAEAVTGFLRSNIPS